MSGWFITLEGGEGSGKTTQARLLADAFRKAGYRTLLTREPGGSDGGDAIRKLLLTGNADKWHPVTEALLFQAARVQHVHQLIKPALARGEVVICDRFLDSSIVYQGVAHGLGIEFVQSLHLMSLGDFMPDLTLYIDISVEIGLERAKGREGEETRFESMDIEFHNKVRNGFLNRISRRPETMLLIDGKSSIEKVQLNILENIQTRLGLKLQ